MQAPASEPVVQPPKGLSSCNASLDQACVVAAPTALPHVEHQRLPSQVEKVQQLSKKDPNDDTNEQRRHVPSSVPYQLLTQGSNRSCRVQPNVTRQVVRNQCSDQPPSGCGSWKGSWHVLVPKSLHHKGNSSPTCFQAPYFGAMFSDAARTCWMEPASQKI